MNTKLNPNFLAINLLGQLLEAASKGETIFENENSWGFGTVVIRIGDLLLALKHDDQGLVRGVRTLTGIGELANIVAPAGMDDSAAG